MTNHQNITATLRCYKFDKINSAEHKELKASLKAMGLRVMSGFSGNTVADYTWYCKHILPLDGKPVELETEHLFDNQWNSAPTLTSKKGLRLFDWTEPYRAGAPGAYGYWLELPEAAKALRDNTLHCGYCGKQTTDLGDGFCSHCLDSEYLKEQELRLLRLLPISSRADRRELTEAEKATLAPRYWQAQVYGQNASTKVRAAAIKAEMTDKRDRLIARANVEFDGFTWLFDHGINLSNVIYYEHTGRFCVGWRRALDPNEAKAMREALQDFAWPLDIVEK